MARPVTFERSDAVASAMDAFWRLGFDGASVEDLTKATGLSRSSLYQEFGSKQGLFDAALDRYEEQVITTMVTELETSEGGVDQIAAFFAKFADAAVNHPVSYGRGCLMTNSMTELGAGAGMAERSLRYTARLRKAFERTLDLAADRGEIAGGDHQGRAELLATLVLGVAARAKGEADADAQVAIAGAVARLVASWR